MVATAMGMSIERIAVSAEGDLDLRGTLGLADDANVGFEAIRLRFEIDAPDASAEDLEALLTKTERYCVVLQTLRQPPRVETTFPS
jgi:uncharacterized OsmC-like protein